MHYHFCFLSGDNIGVGKDKELQLSVRPRSNTGVLAVIYGGGDYLGIELFDGKVIVNMNNGAGDIEAFKDAPDICDGQWRTIKGQFISFAHPPHSILLTRAHW